VPLALRTIRNSTDRDDGADGPGDLDGSGPSDPGAPTAPYPTIRD
jgi:hypothetical protein